MLSEVFARNDITNKKAMTTTVPLHQTIVKYTKSDWMRFVVYAQLTYFRKCNELKCSTNSRRNRNRNRITDQIDQCDCMLKRSLHKRDTLNVASAFFFAFFIWDGFFSLLACLSFLLVGVVVVVRFFLARISNWIPCRYMHNSYSHSQRFFFQCYSSRHCKL